MALAAGTLAPSPRAGRAARRRAASGALTALPRAAPLAPLAPHPRRRTRAAPPHAATASYDSTGETTWRACAARMRRVRRVLTYAHNT
jgi:hypothetical protein